MQPPISARTISLAFAVALTTVCTLPRPAGAQAPVAPNRFALSAVTSQSQLASNVGRDVLRDGGNAIDAAVATAFALAVTHPAAGNIGGGGFLVVLLPDGRTTSFDFRETAPGRATADMFLGADGEYDSRLHHWSHRAVGVPGSVAGLHLAHQRFGKLSWHRLVDPAVRLAAGGFVVSPGLSDSLAGVLDDFGKHPATLAQFSRDGKPLAAGDRLVQTDLARALARIRDDGLAGFYAGETARLFEEEMLRGGGLIRRDDLAGYRAVERVPVRGTYRGYEVIGMPPPSSGGVAVVEMLNILEEYDLRSYGFRSAPEVHLLTEAMRRAFSDRARHLGDADFVDVPVARLASKEHAAKRRRSIRLDRASRSAPDRFEWPTESEETTHLSVVDADRMAVSLTTTIEQPYGVRFRRHRRGLSAQQRDGRLQSARGNDDGARTHRH